MNINEMTWEQIETRTAEIEELLKDDSSDLESLEAEIGQLENRKIELNKEIEERKAIVDEVINTAEEVHEFEERKTTMDEREIRNSKEYIDAYAEYLKSGDDREIRTTYPLLSENAPSGTVAVPEFVYDVVKTAWEKNEILNRVGRANIPGNLKVNFEISATGAAMHIEGQPAPDSENLQLGIVKLVPYSLKKWVALSDEIYDLRGEEFISYIYSEITDKIYKALADRIIFDITAAPTSPTPAFAAVKQIPGHPSLGLVSEALGNLSDEATNPVIIMNKATWSLFKAAQYAANWPVDPFEGLPVIFNNSLPSYTAALTDNEIFMIVGDLGEGVLVNFPKGDNVSLKFDDLSLAEADLIKIVGRLFVADAVVSNYALVSVTAQAAV